MLNVLAFMVNFISSLLGIKIFYPVFYILANVPNVYFNFDGFSVVDIYFLVESNLSSISISVFF